MDLTLRQLTVFAHVARAGSFTAAAHELHLSQSALSRTIQDVEKHLRARLLERDTRNIRLTAEGTELLRVAEHVLASHRAGMRRLTRHLSGDSGTVTIATLPSVAASLLPPVIAAFHANYPDVTVRILDGLAQTVLDHVAAGAADFAITVTGQLPAGLAARPLVTDHFYAVLPPAHPLAETSEVTWRQLAAEPFIAIGVHSSVRALTDSAFARADVRVANLVEATNVATVGGLVAAGLGLSALPALVHSLIEFAHLTHRSMARPAMDRPLGIVVDENLPPTPAAQRFIALLDRFKTSSDALPTGVHWTDGDPAP